MTQMCDWGLETGVVFIECFAFLFFFPKVQR